MLDLLIRRFNHPDYSSPMDMGLVSGKIVYLNPSEEAAPEATKTIVTNGSFPLLDNFTGKLVYRR